MPAAVSGVNPIGCDSEARHLPNIVGFRGQIVKIITGLNRLVRAQGTIQQIGSFAIATSLTKMARDFGNPIFGHFEAYSPIAY
jgi:hypothetical protein